MSTIDPIHSCCKNCVFAIYDNNTQTGCYTEYLDKYKNITDIVEAYDDDKEFYIINKKKCLGYREESWLQKNNLIESTMEQKIAELKSSNSLNFVLMIDLRFFEPTDLDNIANQIKNLQHKPSKIIFIRYQKDQKAHHTYENIKNILDKSDVKCKWRIQTMVDNDRFLDILNNTVNLNKKYRFFCSIEKPAGDLLKVINFANNLVYDKLESFYIISNEDKTILLFSGGLYRYSAVVHKKCILGDDNNYIYI